MYPLVLIIGIGIVKKDKNMPLYALVMSSIGGVIALFHYLLQMGIIPDALAPCVQGISCTSRLIEYFGFITIPFMSLVAFVVIAVSMGVVWGGGRRRVSHIITSCKPKKKMIFFLYERTHTYRPFL